MTKLVLAQMQPSCPALVRAVIRLRADVNREVASRDSHLSGPEAGRYSIDKLTPARSCDSRFTIHQTGGQKGLQPVVASRQSNAQIRRQLGRAKLTPAPRHVERHLEVLRRIQQSYLIAVKQCSENAAPLQRPDNWIQHVLVCTREEDDSITQHPRRAIGQDPTHNLVGDREANDLDIGEIKHDLLAGRRMLKGSLDRPAHLAAALASCHNSTVLHNAVTHRDHPRFSSSSVSQVRELYHDQWVLREFDPVKIHWSLRINWTSVPGNISDVVLILLP